MEGNSIGHCEKYRPYDHVSNFEWLPRHIYSNLQTKSIVKGNKKDEFPGASGILILT